MKYFTIFCLLVVVLAVIQTTYSQECKEGETKKVDCNTCRCENGQFSCTEIGCLTNQDAADCQVGDVKKDDCNTCRCVAGGWACTRKQCLRKRAAQVCEPNKKFKKDCNTCTCNADGTHAACTLAACL